MLTLCDANYAMKKRPDVKVSRQSFEDLSLTFIWHTLGLNALPEHVWTCLNRGRMYATGIYPWVMAQARRHVASVYQ